MKTILESIAIAFWAFVAWEIGTRILRALTGIDVR